MPQSISILVLTVYYINGGFSSFGCWLQRKPREVNYFQGIRCEIGQEQRAAVGSKPELARKCACRNRADHGRSARVNFRRVNHRQTLFIRRATAEPV